jgi:hypothetical protein
MITIQRYPSQGLKDGSIEQQQKATDRQKKIASYCLYDSLKKEFMTEEDFNRRVLRCLDTIMLRIARSKLLYTIFTVVFYYEK